jgi:tetratricopeptide (TPR) repeat protein
MPPEELFSRPLTTASDLYSLGATLICLLTNTNSIDISKLIDENYRFKFKHLVGEIDPRFIAWVTKMVEPNSNNRFANAKVALEALKTLELVNLNDRPSLAQNTIPKLLQYQTTGFVTLIICVTSFLSIGIVRGLLKGLNQSSQTISSNSSAIARSTTSSLEEQWFNQIKPRCNSVEVATTIKSSPPPDTYQGTGYAAGCYALAGKIDKADNLIAQLPANLRPAATYIVFNIGHPVADAGDDESARPIMALVVKYWSENYMAMYHLGMSEYVLKDYQNSKLHLNEFLNMYKTEDGWRQNAITVLGYIDRGVEATPPRSNE